MNCKSLDTEFALEFTYTWTRVRFIKYKKKKKKRNNYFRSSII